MGHSWCEGLSWIVVVVVSIEGGEAVCQSDALYPEVTEGL